MSHQLAKAVAEKMRKLKCQNKTVYYLINEYSGLSDHSFEFLRNEHNITGELHTIETS